MKLSVVMPCFNEAATVAAQIAAVLAVEIPDERVCDREIVVVDDGSTDGTTEILATFDDPRVKVIRHAANRGKGAALQTGFAAATGDILLIQDADLEYEAAEIAAVIAPIVAGKADVVFGSRFQGGHPHRVVYFWHRLANGLLTLLSNMLTDLNLTDMECGTKAFRAAAITGLTIQERGFGCEPELTAKVARRRCRIYEVGISYDGRTYDEGKKIGWRDGVRALWCLVKYNLVVREPRPPSPAPARGTAATARRVVPLAIALAAASAIAGCSRKAPVEPVAAQSARDPLAVETLAKALEAQLAGRFNDAYALYGEALELDDALRGARYQRGVAAFQLGDHANARRFLAASIDKKEEVAAATLLLGVMAAKEKDFAAAETLFLEAGKLAPNDPQIPYNLGELARETGDNTTAVKRYREAVLLKPQEPLFAFKLRLARLEAGEHERVEREAREQLAVANTTGDWLMTAAAINLSRGEWDEAAKMLGFAAAAMQPQMFFAMLQDKVFTRHAERPEIKKFYDVVITPADAADEPPAAKQPAAEEAEPPATTQPAAEPADSAAN
jgi:tetratricopeptide (TPR) repeat protein